MAKMNFVSMRITDKQRDYLIAKSRIFVGDEKVNLCEALRFLINKEMEKEAKDVGRDNTQHDQ